jgi:fructose 1,6-bisphosphatase
MAKVTDMIGDDPLGTAGLNVDPAIAEGTAHAIREVLDRASQEAIELDNSIDHDALFAAWRIMSAVERSTYKALISYGRRKC